MCSIVDQVQPPKAGQNYTVSFSGATPISWDWAITNDGNDSGTTSTSPDQVVIAIPAGTAGEMLTFRIFCDAGGSDVINKVIQV